MDTIRHRILHQEILVPYRKYISSGLRKSFTSHRSQVYNVRLTNGRILLTALSADQDQSRWDDGIRKKYDSINNMCNDKSLFTIFLNLTIEYQRVEKNSSCVSPV